MTPETKRPVNDGPIKFWLGVVGNRLIVQFDEEIKWFGLTKEEATNFSQMIAEEAEKLK